MKRARPWARVRPWSRSAVIIGCIASASPAGAQVPVCDVIDVAPLVNASQRLPAHKALVDEKWRIRIGDDPSWAATNFNDAAWATVPIDEPLSDTMRVHVQNLERKGQHGIAWMRRSLKFSETAECRAFVNLRAFGPADFFIDGKKILSSGDVNQPARGATSRLSPGSQEIVMPPGIVVMAVRLNLAASYDVAPINAPVRTFWAEEGDQAADVRSWIVTGVCAGVLAALGMLHLLLFFALRTQRENLYFGLFALAFSAGLGCVLGAISGTDVRLRFASGSIGVLLLESCLIFLIYFLCSLRHRPVSWLVKVLACLLVLRVVIYFAPGISWAPTGVIQILTVAQGFLIVLPLVAEFLRVIFLGVRERAPGVLTTLFGTAPILILFLLLLVPPIAVLLPEWGLYVCILGPAFAASIFLVRNVAKTSDGFERLSLSLKDEVATQTVELREARVVADEANRAKSDFLANMSHELRTPLNAIIGYSEMLVDESRDTGNEKIIPDLERVHSSGKHLLGLINDVLDLSKVESGKMDLVIEDFDVASLISQVRATIQPLLHKNHNELVCDVSIAAGRMCSDEVKVRQILFNLLSNSSKFTSNGTIALNVSRIDDEVTFAVKDSGIGMTQAQLAKLFQPFAQAETTTSRKFGGTGLGLTISKRFAELMGGTIDVDSEHGVGTTFTLRLPAAAPGLEPVAA